ncbi:MAG: 4Fe-4S dicluster domain-containing protein [Eubacteriales bacterium]|nr:4Fe-4S dicluster domain-containing protein [Eubacteriales bacterium]
MKRIFIDAAKCDGCKNCTVACMQAHRPDAGTIYDLDLTDIRCESRNHIVISPDGSYKPIFCRHCDQPECVLSCMSGALAKDPETGHVLYDEKKCGSCFMCVMNCPYGVLKPDTATRTKVIKCDFCKDDPEGPSCVRACPKQAIFVQEVDA